MLLIGVLHCGVAVHTRGFGCYKQLYPLVLFQSLLGEGLVALAVVMPLVSWGVSSLVMLVTKKVAPRRA